MRHRFRDQPTSEQENTLRHNALTEGFVPAWIIDAERTSREPSGPQLEAPPPPSAWPNETGPPREAPRDDTGGTVIVIDI
jgi:hypothetical protein